MAIPTILRGDTSSVIRLNIAPGDYNGCTLIVSFYGVQRKFKDIKGGAVISLEWTAAETETFPLGTGKLIMTAYKGESVKTLPFAKVKVTDAPSEVYSEAITINPDVIDLSALDENASLGDVKTALNTLVSAVRKSAPLLALLAFPAFADLTPDTPLDAIPGNATISNIVASAGIVASGAVPEGVATTNDIAEVKAEIKAETDAQYEENKSAIASVSEVAKDAQNTANTIATLVIGDDCQLVSTNYNSATKMPSLFLRFKIKDEATGEMVWHNVWDELTRWDYLFDTYLPTNYLTKSEVQKELDNKADRAWGFFDSHTGSYAPNGYTWVSSPKVAIAANMSYQRIISSGNGIFVLCSNGLVTELGNNASATNGFFRIEDDKGNAIFEITKGTATMAWATAADISIETVNGIAHMFIPYKVEADAHPKIYACTDLSKKDWKAEDEEGFLFNVDWTGTSGNYIAEVWPKQTTDQAFVKAEYNKGSKDIIKHNAPVALTTIVIKGVEYPVNIETINGKKVLVLE